jgi:hypothetical protein
MAADFILITVRGDLDVHGVHGSSVVCLGGMGGQEDYGVIDEEEQRHIDEAWRKAGRRKRG